MVQDRRVTRTKTALTRALLELLGEKEFSKISITELAQRADVDRKTFYLHYQSVGDILDEHYEKAVQQLSETVEKQHIFHEQADMQGFFRALNEQMSGNLDLYRRLVRGPGSSYLTERLRKLLKDALLQIVGNRTNRPEVETQLYCEVFAAGVIQAYITWLRGDVTLSEDRLAELVGEIVNRGMEL